MTLELAAPSIFLRHQADGSVLVARCFAPVTRLMPPKTPYCDDLIRCLIECQPNSKGTEVLREHIPFPGDFGDEAIEFAFAITASNVRVLLATGFEWTPEAEAAVEGVEDPWSIKALRKAAIELASERAQSFRIRVEEEKRYPSRAEGPRRNATPWWRRLWRG